MSCPVLNPVVLVLHGPSGVGKESIIAGLQAATGIHRATSTTDRKPRHNERDGIDYHFVTTAEFKRRIEARQFAEHARVFGDWKGLERAEIEGPIARGEDVIIRTDVQGARRWRKALEGAVHVILLATEPSRPAAEQRSLTERRILFREPGIDPGLLAKRLAELEEEIADLPNNDYFVVNAQGELEGAVARLLEIIAFERQNPQRPRPRLVPGPQ